MKSRGENAYINIFEKIGKIALKLYTNIYILFFFFFIFIYFYISTCFWGGVDFYRILERGTA